MDNLLKNLFFSKENRERESFIRFSDIVRDALEMNLQKASWYVGGFKEFKNGEMVEYPSLGKGLRFEGDSIMNPNSLKIHKDDVEKFVKRVRDYEAGLPYLP